jgi:regulator of sigma E protease
LDFFLHTILPFFGILVLLIVVHELGHYFTAKLTGVKVLEAGLGYPPRVWGFTWRDTIYSINLLPLGGFVRLLGEEDPSDPESLAAKPRWVRLLVLASGSGMNFVLPVLLFAIAFMIPRDVNVGFTEITNVVEGSPAQEAGLQSGDTIYEINGHEVRNVQEVSLEIRLNLGETLDFFVKHQDGVTETLPVHARWTPPSGQGPTGIQIANKYPSRRRRASTR